jgi:hypothetical protein
VRKVLKIAASVLLVLLIVGACEPTWLHLTSEGSGVVGEADVGPTCPDMPCPPGHLAISAVVTRRGWPGVAAVIRTGADGRFRVQLRPGRYTLRVIQSPWRSQYLPYLTQPTIPVRVRAHVYTPVTVNYDNGLR